MKRNMIILAGVLTLGIWCSSALGYQLTFQPRVTLSEDYSDNIYLSDDDPRSDFITTITPGFTAQALTQHSGAELSYDPGYAMYARFDENDTWRQDAKFRAWTDFSKDTHLELSNQFLRTEDPLSEEELRMMREEEVALNEAPTVRVGRQPYITNTANALLHQDFGAHSGFDLGYTYRLLNNDDPTVIDNQSHNPFFGLAYWPTVRWGIEPRMEYLHAIYEGDIGTFDDWLGGVAFVYRFTPHLNAFVQYDHTYRSYDTDVPAVQDFHVYDPSMGIQYEWTPAITLGGRVGYFLQDNEDIETEGGYYFDADGKWKAEHKMVSLKVGHGYDRAELEAENLGLTRYTRVRAKGEIEFTQHVRGDMTAYYRKSEYLNTPDQRDDDFYGAAVGLEYELFEWMFLRVQYDYNQVESTVNESSYTENRALIKVTLTPARPWRMLK